MFFTARSIYIKNETKLSAVYLDYFAFAEEKLTELKEISEISKMSESTLSGGITVQEYLNANKQLFQV